ncbi:TonB-dependent receptor [Sphingobium sp. Ant17]|uniref:TonB-dependent receptor n=1 Tax=Sphingobium sp. Ant17 TaxID=1461752 RepID=UPI000447039F|nr:TonB-dependent receptor [Sphingobium sp. Ant17]EXS68836.1 TonB-dependent receptor [Sphingobium sp. Ant17]
MSVCKGSIRLSLLAASALGSLMLSQAALAQADAPAAEAAPQIDNEQVNDIVVTGYRASLQNSTNAKRDATGFSDSIFAQDIGKFPDTNIAESFNRIPGITINRDVNGEGVNVAIRGLGSNFTNVTLNGAPIAVSSSGATDAQGTDRSVDLSFFPTDLFTKLTVNKSYTVNLLEGGAAGNIDMRSARPFDRPGTRLTYSMQGTKQSGVDRIGARGSMIFSTTNDTVGFLVGVSGQRLFTDNRGYETIGYTNPALTAAQCGAATGCNTTGGGNWTIPATVPVGAGAGTVPGQTIDQAWLLANNPGATIQQIDNGILPRLGRFTAQYGRRDRINAIASAEWRPNDAMNFYVDGLYGYKQNDLTRENIAWIVRNGQLIPTNTTYDREDCATGCQVTSGTFANSQFFLEYRPLTETTELFSVNPGLDWEVSDRLKLSIQANYTRSTFHREIPTAGPVTAMGTGVSVDYTANANGAPSIVSSVDLNDPNNFVWNGGRVNMSDERRRNETKGVRGALTWGDERFNLQVGGNYDDVSRRIRGFDNSQAWQNAVCGGNPNVFVPGPNSQPPCVGAASVAPGTPGYPTYPGYGTGSTAGQSGPVSYGGSLIPVGQLPSFLMPGRAGFVTVDWDRFKQASNYDSFHENTPESGGSNTGASGGLIREKSFATYFMAAGKQQVGDNELRFNVGVRYVKTDQTIEGRVSLADPRNTLPDGSSLPDGSRYPSIVTLVRTSNSYDKWLPAATVAYDIGDLAVVRAAYSKTMTRPDPAAQLPGVGFGDPSAATATIGNPALNPYFSDNLDFGVELYTGQEGLVSLNAFRKSLTGFTTNQITTQPFSFLAQYGITYDSLNPTQAAAIDLRGGPSVATIQVQSQVNVPNKLTVNGLEFQWIQPLDFLTESIGVRGFGFNANATIVDQRSDGPAVAFGVAPFTYNLIGYYENGGVNLRVSTTFREGSQSSGANQNGIPTAALYSDNYQQWDFSSSFDLEELFGWNGAPQLTVDVQNFTNSTLRSYFQYEGATFTQYRPGVQYLVGLRGTF